MTRLERILCVLVTVLPFLTLPWLPLFENGLLPRPVFEITRALTSETPQAGTRIESVSTVFPDGIPKVYCWFFWKHGTPGTKLILHWYYLDRMTHLKDFSVMLPGPTGDLAVPLTHPAKETLPTGSYGIEFEQGGKIVKVCKFVVIPKIPTV
ncbi:MAG: hypothetical protein HY714_00405 [Candidatus Omnitrophica bacterium]|nr:hypothetical protein [Candidatus Omnitrophota bacterium]